jgi:hypothetical protein
MNDNSIMPFGAYKGQEMKNVPANYLLYAYSQHWISNWPDVRDYIKENLDVLNKEEKENKS